jgi:hypothetical protein
MGLFAGQDFSKVHGSVFFSKDESRMMAPKSLR